MLAAVARTRRPVQRVVAQVEQCAREGEHGFAKPGIVTTQVGEGLRPIGLSLEPLQATLSSIEPPVTTKLQPDLDAEVRAVFATARGRY